MILAALDSTHTQTPHMRLWAELRDHGQVPHHGASLSPELRYRELRPQLPPSLATKVLCLQLGLFCPSVCLSVWRRPLSRTVQVIRTL